MYEIYEIDEEDFDERQNMSQVRNELIDNLNVPVAEPFLEVDNDFDYGDTDADFHDAPMQDNGGGSQDIFTTVHDKLVFFNKNVFLFGHV